MTEQLLVEHRGTVCWVTLNRPEARNALSQDINLRLQDLAIDLNRDDDTRIIVLTGAGDQAFCAGADLKERKGVSADETAPFLNAIGGAINGWAEIRKPTIAALNGSAFGGGLELALACDFRIAVDTAQVGLTEVRLGIIPGAGGTVRLPRLIGEARAKEMIMLGRRISAARAHEFGLLMSVVPRSEFPDAIDALTNELAGVAPQSAIAAKSSIERSYGRHIEEALHVERECYEVVLYTEDRDEGLLAFAEGRPPRYTGR